MHYFKANVGNLMQHWVLCEILEVLKRQFNNLLYIDAYAMAPFSIPKLIEKPERNTTRRLFEEVRDRLPGQKSLYELLWLEAITHSDGQNKEKYPSSTVFVYNFWKRRLNRKLILLLCEICPSKAEEIKTWLSNNQIDENSLSRGDWRIKFREPISSADSHVILISFDPNMYNYNEGEKWSEKNMYPNDLNYWGIESDLPMIVQLSSYANVHIKDGQLIAESDIKKRMANIGFLDCCCVKANKEMMSLIFWRKTDLSKHFEALEMRFKTWLDRATKKTCALSQGICNDCE